MHTAVEIRGYRESSAGTELVVSVPDRIGGLIKKKEIRSAQLRLDDGRHISAEQRKKAYATMRDISDYTGYLPEEQKQWLKYLYICRTGREYIHLSDCSMDEAREFINVILDYALENGIPLSENALERTDDINRYIKSARYAAGPGRYTMRTPSGWGMTGGRWMTPGTGKSACAGSTIPWRTRLGLYRSGRCTGYMGSFSRRKGGRRQDEHL